MIELFYTTYISVDLAHQVIFHAKVGKGGTKRFGRQEDFLKFAQFILYLYVFGSLT